MYRVVAKIENVGRENGEAKYMWCEVRAGIPRGTAEALCAHALREGVRVDMQTGSTLYPAHRILEAQVIPSDQEEPFDGFRDAKN
jgi:hypothetical protein